MGLGDDDWASAVSYFHGKGAAPKETDTCWFVGILIFGLVVVTVVTLIVEFL